MCDWAQVSEGERKQGGRRVERGRECMRERKDESNALQQRTVTDRAFILAETAAVAGRTQRRRRRWRQNQDCFHHSWRGGEHKEVKTQGTLSGEYITSPMPPEIWFLEYYFGFSSFVWQHMRSFLSFLILLSLSPFPLSWIKEVLMPGEAWIEWWQVPVPPQVRH